ncbi:phosphoglycerate mutase family protein [Streptomyces sp. YIM 130001]|uniref:phosphoglycerate mutase family protein n=1 Tax=Streptomyces sp. YIM 130001 TaxID=2259644 RepID=UPI0019699D7D|nr:phosphoglycerate mutase family protein [Streptomyces sp. YIM 130001]
MAFSAAEAAGPLAGPVPGRDRDVPLSALGVAQASALGAWLAGLPLGTCPDVVVSSPFRRTGRPGT